MFNIDTKQFPIFQKTSFVDLFAGIGGFRLALDSFDSKCVFTSEWDANCQKIYNMNFNGKVFGDITKIPNDSIPPHVILCAGFPCQPFSISGKKEGFLDSRGVAFFEIVRIIQHHRPSIVILENVKNFETHDHGKTLKVICQSFHHLGYDLFYKVLNASHFGVPQARKRIFFVALEQKLGIRHFDFPEGVPIPTRLVDFCLSDHETNEYVIQRNDICWDNRVVITRNIFVDFPQKPIRIGTINKGGQGERIYHEYGHAITLSAHGGGIGAKTGIYRINGRLRRLAPRECARICGFPEWFVLSKNKSVAYKQLGNSVVVNVVQEILKKIANVLMEKDCQL